MKLKGTKSKVAEKVVRVHSLKETIETIIKNIKTAKYDVDFNTTKENIELFKKDQDYFDEFVVSYSKTKAQNNEIIEKSFRIDNEFELIDVELISTKKYDFDKTFEVNYEIEDDTHFLELKTSKGSNYDILKIVYKG